MSRDMLHTFGADKLTEELGTMLGDLRSFFRYGAKVHGHTTLNAEEFCGEQSSDVEQNGWDHGCDNQFSVFHNETSWRRVFAS